MKHLSLSFIAAITFLLLLAGPLSAQFNISAEFRPRMEYRDGYSKLRDSTLTPYGTILGRTRFFFDYKSDRFQARFALQHAYVWGDNSLGQDTITKNTINIYEGWFQYNFTPVAGLKLGRMEIIYDNQRLIGNSNWSPQGITYDAAMVRWNLADKSYRGEATFALNNTAPPTTYLVPYTIKNFKYLAMWYNREKLLKDQLVMSFLAILDVNQKSSTSKTKTTYDTLFVYDGNDSIIGSTVLPNTSTTTTSYPTILFGRFTGGGTVEYTKEKLNAYAEGYFQCGHFTDGRSITAGFFGLHASYQVLKHLNLMAGYEMLSGNNYSDTTALKTKVTSFSTLYGTAHSKYGYMDLFSSYVKSGNTAGLTNLYARLTVSFAKKMSLEATWRKFGLTHPYLSSSKKPYYTSAGKNLGNEFDFMYVYKILGNFEVNAAYCFYLPTSTMERLNGLTPGTAKFAQYAYVMLTYKPNFFNSEKK